MFFDRLLAQVREDQIGAMAQMIAYTARNTNSAALHQALEPGGDVDPVAEYVPVLDHHIADIDADAKTHLRAGLISGVHRSLNFDGAGHGLEYGCELREHTIAGGVGNATSMASDQLVQDGASRR